MDAHYLSGWLSRFLLYAQLVEKESSWNHIQALQSVVIKHGTPLAYYTDCHSIFRYVKGRDQRRMSFEKFNDDVDPQWKMVIKDCNVKDINHAQRVLNYERDLTISNKSTLQPKKSLPVDLIPP